MGPLPLLLAAVLAQVSPSPAWTHTDPIGGEGNGVGAPTLLFDGTGPGLLTWGGNKTHLASWAPGKPPSEQRAIDDALLVPPIPVSGHAAFFLRQQIVVVTKDFDTIVRVGTSTGTLDGDPGKFSELRHRTHFAPYAAARSPRTKEVAVAWIEPLTSGGNLHLRLAIRPAGGRFGRVMDVAELGPAEHPGVFNPALAYDKKGRLVLAYPVVRGRKRQVHALIGRPGSFRRQVLGKHLGIAEIVAATSASGRIVVGWWTQDGGEEANGPAQVRAASRDPGGTLFHRTQLLDPGDWHSRAPGRLVASVDADGAALLTWSQVQRHAFPVVVSAARPGHSFGAPQQLDANGASGDIAFDPGGRALVVWSRILRGNEQEPDQIFAALREAGGKGFGAAEAVSESRVATRPAAAFDPSTQNFVAAWSEIVSGPPPEAGGNNAVIRGAYRK
jgi:hypothetical protein